MVLSWFSASLAQGEDLRRALDLSRAEATLEAANRAAAVALDVGTLRAKHDEAMDRERDHRAQV